MQNNPLTGILSPASRQKLYFSYALVGLICGGAQVAYSSLQMAQPPMLTAALAVYAFVGIALGFTAASNTRPQDAGRPAGEPVSTPVPANGSATGVADS